MSRQIVTPKLSGIGINYYHESMGFMERSDSQIDADLDRMLTFTNKIKLYNHVLDTDNTVCLNIASRAKAKGFHVTWVENPDGDPVKITASQFNGAYRTAVLANAAAALAIGVDIFIIGNEMSVKVNVEDYADDAVFIADVKSLVTAAKEVFTGEVSYQEGWWKAGAWDLAGLGSLENIYFNVYESQNDFKINCLDMFTKFGTNLVIGEFSASNYVDDLYPQGMGENEEDDFYRHIANRIEILRTIGINDAYYFTNKEVAGHGVVVDDLPSYRKAWNALVGGRMKIV